MKKLIGFMLALAMLLSLGTCAFAAEAPAAKPAGAPETAPAPARVTEEKAPTAGLPVEEPAAAPEETEVTAGLPVEEEVAVEDTAPAEVLVPETPAPAPGQRIDCPNVGISLRLPEALTELKGTLSFNGVVLCNEDGIREVELDYTAVPLERYDELYNAVFTRRNALPEEIREFTGSNVRILSVFCVGNGKGFAELADAYEKYYDMPLQAGQAEKIASDGARSFYLCRHYETDGKTLPAGEYADELARVLASVNEIVNSITIE